MCNFLNKKMSGVTLVFLWLTLFKEYSTDDPQCPYSDDIYFIVNPANCNEYIECIDGTKFELNCPPGLGWNSTHDYCDFIDNITCTLVCPPNVNLKVAYPYDCNKYYQCQQGEKDIKNCPETMYFNPTTVACDYMDNVECAAVTTSTSSPTTTAPTTTTTPTTTPRDDSSTSYSICPSVTETVDIPYPYDCGKYYHCAKGVPNVRSCPENLYFNPKTALCDYMDNVYCSISTTRIPTTSADSCSLGPTGPESYKGYTFSCQNSTTPAPTTETTRTDSTSTSSTKTTPGSTVEPTTIDPNAVCQGVPDGSYVADPVNCRNYYECAFGKGTLFRCPTGTRWDETVTSCVNFEGEC